MDDAAFAVPLAPADVACGHQKLIEFIGTAGGGHEDLHAVHAPDGARLGGLEFGHEGLVAADPHIKGVAVDQHLKLRLGFERFLSGIGEGVEVGVDLGLFPGRFIQLAVKYDLRLADLDLSREAQGRGYGGK